ncbi:MAG: response regulator transcription factor [Flavobacteriales bacterium]|nr:response regulator transcription factor [Flavobacteriales bacterium]
MKARPIVRIALIDDHWMVRDGLEQLIHSIEGYEVVVTASNGRELIDTHAEPDGITIAIVDMYMPVMSGAETTAWLLANWPQVRVLAISVDNSPENQTRAYNSGACGFIAKGSGREAFRRALEDVTTKGYHHYVSPREVPGATSAQAAVVDPFADLTAAELRVLDCACTVDEPTWALVADRLGIAEATVDTHRASLFKKLHVKSKAGLVSFGRAHRCGAAP